MKDVQADNSKMLNYRHGIDGVNAKMRICGIEFKEVANQKVVMLTILDAKLLARCLE